MSFFEALILGVVEGITELLPISSTAHLMLASEILKVDQSEFLKSFEIVIQFGAICAVIFVFRRRLLESFGIWRKIALAFVPTAIIGFLLYEFIKTQLLTNIYIAVWSLVIGGLIFIIVEKLILKPKTDSIESIEKISDKHAILIGLVQSIAVIPGVSRSAATIISALLLGANRKTAVEFSFLLAIPTIGAAAGYDLVKNLDVLHGNMGMLTVGFVTSFVSAIFAIKFLLSFVRNHSFVSFGIYRIIIGLVFLIFVL